MFHFWNAFTHYLRDRSGAYAVNTALIFGTLFLAAHVGIGSMRVQNSVTGAEQLVDIACQKIGEADPAIYPTPEAVKAAVEKQMASRSIAGSNANEGTITVEPGVPDPSYVQPIEINLPNQSKSTTNATNMDLRRITFVVKYSGAVKGLHRDIAKDGSAPVIIKKPCKPVCKPRGNIIYDNPSALGHWYQNGFLKAGSLQADSKGTLTTFTPVSFSRGLTNPVPPGTRLVFTIFDTSERIKYRRIIDTNEPFYIDDNANRGSGEPPKTITRLVVDSEDQLIIQTLNSDGSIPAICDGETQPDCGVCGTNNPGPQPPSTVINNPRRDNCIIRDYVGKLPEIFPTVRSFRIEAYRPDRYNVVFNYPVNGNAGSVVAIYTSPDRTVSYTFPLAPDYIPNTQLVKLNYKNKSVMMPSEKYSMLRHFTSSNFYATFLDIERRYPVGKNLFHLRAHNWSYWWDDVNDKCFVITSPIVFDTKNRGEIITTQTGQIDPDRERNPLFDLEGTGEMMRVEWPVGDGQAWLVDNRDGRAAFDMNGKRFFGNLEDDDGYQKLRRLDTSGTGILTGADLEGLALWFDNGNAQVEEGELRALSDLGITAVDTRAEWQKLANGRMVLRATAVMHGQTIMTEDVFVEMALPERVSTSSMDHKGSQ